MDRNDAGKDDRLASRSNLFDGLFDIGFVGEPLKERKRVRRSGTECGKRGHKSLCVSRRCDPRALSSGDNLRALQQTLLDDDGFLRIPFSGAQADAIRLVPEATWGGPDARMFGFEPVSIADFVAKGAPLPDGPHFSQRAAEIAREDLAPPENGKESDARAVAHGAA